MNFSFIEKIIISYLEKNPQIIEKLVEALINALLSHLSSSPTPPAA